MGNELDKNYYNDRFSVGGHNQRYFRDAEDINDWYPSWKTAYDYVIKNNIKSIVDLGCGPGHLSSLFKKSDGVKYIGYDFSDVAINQAIERNQNNPNVAFEIKNLKNFTPNDSDKFYTSFEFLEHVSFDLEILSSLPKDSEIIFSVPNFDSPGHVRYFNTDNDIITRYNQILELKKITFHNGIYIYYGKRK